MPEPAEAMPDGDDLAVVTLGRLPTDLTGDLPSASQGVLHAVDTLVRVTPEARQARWGSPLLAHRRRRAGGRPDDAQHHGKPPKSRTGRNVHTMAS